MIVCEPNRNSIQPHVNGIEHSIFDIQPHVIRLIHPIIFIQPHVKST